MFPPGPKKPPMTHTLSLVAFGGAAGATLRYLVLLAWPAPWGVLAINVMGSFAIGLLAQCLPPRLVPLLLTGGLGGFTTFSAFSLDALRLAEAGRLISATLYVAGSVGLSLLACLLGLWMGRLA